jgi:hypothetical protein
VTFGDHKAENQPFSSFEFGINTNKEVLLKDVFGYHFTKSIEALESEHKKNLCIITVCTVLTDVVFWMESHQQKGWKRVPRNQNLYRIDTISF